MSIFSTPSEGKIVICSPIINFQTSSNVNLISYEAVSI